MIIYSTLKAKMTRLLKENSNRIPTLYCTEIPTTVVTINAIKVKIAITSCVRKNLRDRLFLKNVSKRVGNCIEASFEIKIFIGRKFQKIKI